MRGRFSAVKHRCTRRGLLTVAAGAVSSLLVRTPAAFAADSTPLLFEQLYKSFGVRGYELSGVVRSLAGKSVAMHGYMAPPLKAESNFFVLTREPMALCPFCQSDADWPVDIVVVYLANASVLFNGGTPVAARGRLEVGPWTDPETGFVSQIRILDAAIRHG